MADALHVLGIAGSLRKGSYNRSLLRAAIESAPEGMTISEHPLEGIPFYNYDVEVDGDPAPVQAFKQAIAGADALLIVTPEYQHGIPGVLKNALDWAARPPGRSVLTGKPLAMMGATPGFVGTARAQTQLREHLTFSRVRTISAPEVLVSRAHERFDEEGHLTDDTTRKFIVMLLEELRKETEMLRAAGR